MLETSEPLIYQYARILAIKTVEAITRGNGSANGNGESDEIAFWINLISRDSLDDFCKLLDATQKITVQHPVIMFNISQKYLQPCTKLNGTMPTLLLSTALVSIASDMTFFSELFIISVCKVCFIALLHSLQPKILASFVKYALADISFSGRVESVQRKVEALIKYSESIITDDKRSTLEVCEWIATLLNKSSIFSKVYRYLTGSTKTSTLILHQIKNEIAKMQCIDASLILKQCCHHYKLENEIDEYKLVEIFCLMFPILNEVRFFCHSHVYGFVCICSKKKIYDFW